MSTYIRVPLGEVCAINPRPNIGKYSGDMEVSFVPMAAIDEQLGEIANQEKRLLADVSRGYSSFKNGDVLFAKITPCMENGKATVASNLINGIGYGSTEFYVLRPNKYALSKYIFYVIRQPQFRNEAKINFTGTAGQQRVPKSFVENVLIPLPALDEQHRIVNILDRVAKIERLQIQSKKQSQEFMPALYASAYNNSVKAANPYPFLRLADIANVVAGDPAPQDPQAFAPDGPLFVRMRDVGRHHRHSALSDSTDRLSIKWIEKNRLRLFPRNSILIPKSGASINLNHRAKLATDAYVVSHLAVVIPDQTKVDPNYLYLWAINYDPRAQVQVTGLPSLKLSILKSALVLFPPLEKQRQIANILNRVEEFEQLRRWSQGRLQELNEVLVLRLLGYTD